LNTALDWSDQRELKGPDSLYGRGECSTVEASF
jgi:hypothetical protein